MEFGRQDFDRVHETLLEELRSVSYEAARADLDELRDFMRESGAEDESARDEDDVTGTSNQEQQQQPSMMGAT